MDTESILEFKSLNLLPSILTQVEAKGYINPTPIQVQAIPHLLEGKDLLGIAKTGSGKTAAFSLPLIDKLGRNKASVTPNHIRSLILSPTRELATQIENNIINYAEGLELKTKVVFGGVGKQPQIDALDLGLDVLVATLGRLLDLIERGHIKFDELEVFVLDEADMMLDMGFLGDVKKVISFLPQEKQTLLFSATMPKAIENLANNLLNKPVKVEVDAESSLVETIEQKIYTVEKSNKGYLLQSMLEDPELTSVLLFCKTKFGAERIIENLELIPVTCATIHSNKAQGEREKALKAFRKGDVRILVATDIAARGIDIKNVSHVINYNLPEDPKNYIHRIGRTGRAGSKGTAISFCVESEVVLLKSIGKLIKQKIEIDSNQPFHKEISLSFKASAKSKNTKRKRQRRRKG
jgi:ATP-dependent RNA helicase RhlE